MILIKIPDITDISLSSCPEENKDYTPHLFAASKREIFYHILQIKAYFLPANHGLLDN
jgi:hypothetical protein